MSVADPHKLILTGENPFLRMSDKDGDPNSTDASYWRILFCPAGPGHVLYIKSELTHGHWRIYSDNIAMARWLQQTVQGMLNPDLKDVSIPVTDAVFSKSGGGMPNFAALERTKEAAAVIDSRITSFRLPVIDMRPLPGIRRASMVRMSPPKSLTARPVTMPT